MDRNKKIFIISGIIFLIILVIIGLDIASRTTFPGAKGNLEERILPNDTIQSGEKK